MRTAARLRPTVLAAVLALALAPAAALAAPTEVPVVAAAKDWATVHDGGQVAVEVLANDRYDRSAGPARVSLLYVSNGLHAVAGGNGKVYVIADPGVAGRPDLGVKYRLTVAGRTSDTWIAVTARPTEAVALKDWATVVAGGQVAVDVLANDRHVGGTPRVEVVTTSAGLTAVVGGNRKVYVVADPRTAGRANLGVKYRLTVNHRVAETWIAVTSRR
ncbi:hypothetical protein RDV89_19595 [Nocardioides zeae]|uniref:DUF4397 domain-containing protein n=1 Tax=Nocardioides imazamoxiresistens TaxID=3231893 RepID=A0ABU3Q1B1_9ACTN|nr:hypothetical protein [Nocardioides zeae]MDT9595301.1 hypothetical protein [Nocardioides zeae]